MPVASKSTHASRRNAALGAQHNIGGAARLTAPASGLFLERVFYEGDRRDLPVQAAVAVNPVE